jgi:hypothetical protein
MIRNTSLALAAACALAASASAQTVQSSTQKFFLGAALNGTSIKFEGDGNETENGGGLSLQLGYGFTPKFALFLEGTAASIQDDESDASLTAAHFDIGARYHFTNPQKKLVPFLELAFTGRALSEDDAEVDDGSGGTTTADVTLSGAGFSFGGGLLYFFSPKFALNSSLKWTTGEFTTFKIDNVSVDGFEADATSARLSVGFSWFPKGG